MCSVVLCFFVYESARFPSTGGVGVFGDLDRGHRAWVNVAVSECGNMIIRVKFFIVVCVWEGCHHLWQGKVRGDCNLVSVTTGKSDAIQVICEYIL